MFPRRYASFSRIPWSPSSILKAYKKECSSGHNELLDKTVVGRKEGSIRKYGNMFY